MAIDQQLWLDLSVARLRRRRLSKLRYKFNVGLQLHELVSGFIDYKAVMACPSDSPVASFPVALIK